MYQNEQDVNSCAGCLSIRSQSTLQKQNDKSTYTDTADPASISQQPVHSVNLIIRPAGVAQSVERVALIIVISTTSRSRVRAPPSAIPIHSAVCFFLFCPGGVEGG
ncbi:hypothetical protein M438DRAFT_165258 [Aureobasidium pullulans EXF-150]|uniref:Uncharacterized protein n=1 Tax=Aureobasidium pullulans EXF-150 TaxID=1043002 RepID=A0A074XNZ5_AURPU|nr:uncharacterized protein M438DRAFT_165258 [Aureobasidium pullulans EXF-150]KEQ87225.1 hypothetical protein M438DRAFT_165258 [Aureobasidium pullulans EXF-150]